MSAKKAPSSPDPSRGTQAPPPRLTWWLTAGSLLVVAALVGVLVLTFTGDDHTAPDPTRVAELQASAQQRDRAQVDQLVERTTAAHGQLVPVVESLDAAVPPDGSTPAGEAPGAGEVDSWLETVQEAAVHFEDAPSGDSGHNVAHAGLSNAVDLLGSAVVAYSNAERAQDGQRAELLELAGDLRTQAVRGWSVAATQLDMVSVESGHGHVHLYLPAAPGSGALGPDGAEPGEGGGAPAEGGADSGDQ
ncbi:MULTISPECIES: hypothetical protein [Nocardiopsis]|uniref:hypothetical protein n=1 Tax=Nocardiopsis TaxID=2013 RepID=UPI00036C19F9|nr:MULTISPECIES: hypothetical protein [Nocardiopsis]ASU58820.1 hypothetical protein CGQ36_15175 [Nocardiopsis dassonvillei]